MLASQATTAYALKKVWPEITLHIVPDAGHSSREPGTAKLLVEVRSAVSVTAILCLTYLHSGNRRVRMFLNVLTVINAWKERGGSRI